jgi:hypothetical protein
MSQRDLGSARASRAKPVRLGLAAPRRNVLPEEKARDGGAPSVRAGLANAREGACAPRSKSALTNRRWLKNQRSFRVSSYFVQAFQRLRIGLV